MRFSGSVVIATLLFAGCSKEPAAPAAPAVPAAQVQGTLNQVMRGILFPNSNVVFDAQDKDPGAPVDRNDPAAAANPYAGLYGGWEALENASIAMYETANIIELPGRTCQNGKAVPIGEETFKKGLAALREASMYSYKNAQSKNKDGIADVGEKLAAACATCHDVYRDRVINGQPMTMEQRCAAQ